MAVQALFYEQAVPVTTQSHGNWSIEARASFAYSRQANCVPLVVAEFANAAGESPIVFVDNRDTVLPAAVLGLKSRENQHISETGEWEGRYIPAFVRRYPFIFAANDSGNSFTLCIDESFSGFNQEGTGERLFEDDGSNTAYLQQVLSFLKEYEIQYRLTEEFCKRLKAFDLLEPVQANVSLVSGKNMAVTGFRTVSRDRLTALDGAVLVELVGNGVLELIYIHLFSLENFSRLTERLNDEKDDPRVG